MKLLQLNEPVRQTFPHRQEPAKALYLTHPCIIQSCTGHRYLSYRHERDPLNQRTRTHLCGCGETWQPDGASAMRLKVSVDRNRERLTVVEDCRLFHYDEAIWYAVTNREHLYLGRTTEHSGTLIGHEDAILAFPFEAGAVEKNWGFFEHEKQLYGVRWVHQHAVHRIGVDFGAGHYVYPAEPTDWRLEWPFGKPHGGTCPVRFGADLYLSIFQSHTIEGGARVYRAGAYMFEAKPPFTVKYGPSKPILDAWSAGFNGHKVVFPLGIVWDRKDTWAVSFGDDRSMYIAEFSTDEILAHVKAV